MLPDRHDLDEYTNIRMFMRSTFVHLLKANSMVCGVWPARHPEALDLTLFFRGSPTKEFNGTESNQVRENVVPADTSPQAKPASQGGSNLPRHPLAPLAPRGGRSSGYGKPLQNSR